MGKCIILSKNVINLIINSKSIAKIKYKLSYEK